MEYIFFDESSSLKGVNIPKSQVGFRRMTNICNSAEILFSEKGFYDTSVADICKHAKTAVGTFYIYFQDKTAIYHYLVRNYYVVITKYINKHILKCKTRYEIEREGLKAFIRFGYAHPQCFKIIWGSSHIDPVLFEEYYSRYAKSYVEGLERFSGEIINIDYSTMAWCLMGIGTFICLKVVLDHKRLTEKELNTLVDDVMKMLSAGMFQ
jgi:AcrR family transcriptional regulator